jgi:hypothetical protein
MVKLAYLGTDKGLIIKAISVDNLRQWAEIRDHLEWNNDQLKTVTKALKKESLLEETGGGFKVDYSLWLEYKAHFGDEWAKRKLKEIADGNDWKTQIIQKNLAEKQKREETHLAKSARALVGR